MDLLEQQSLIGILNHCCMVGGRKPASAATEISIPDRDLSWPSIFNDITVASRKLILSSDAELYKTVLQSTWWRKPSSTETEIRCTRSLYPSGVTPLFQAQNHHSDNSNSGDYQMVSIEQLALFDLHLYTVRQIAKTDSGVFQIKKAQPCIEYEQIELNLFPKQFYQTPFELLILAA